MCRPKSPAHAGTKQDLAPQEFVVQQHVRETLFVDYGPKVSLTVVQNTQLPGDVSQDGFGLEL